MSDLSDMANLIFLIVASAFILGCSGTSNSSLRPPNGSEAASQPEVPEEVPAEPVIEAIRLEASRVRPEGTFITETETPILGAWIPSQLNLVIRSTSDESINMNGQWAKIVIDSITVCYQARQTSSIVQNREFIFRRAITQMVGDCHQNTTLPSEYQPLDFLEGSSVTLTLLNSGRIQNQHVTSTVSAEFDVLK